MNIIAGSWRSKTFGAVTILIAISGALKLVLDDDATTNPDWNIIGAQISVGWALLCTRDNKVSSEQVGIK